MELARGRSRAGPLSRRRAHRGLRAAAIVATVLCAVTVSVAFVVVLSPVEGHRPPVHPSTPVDRMTSEVTPGPRLDAADWATVRHVARLRTMAVARGRTAMYRSFAAYMGLSGLLGLHHVRPGPCATAISYLYNNLLDLHDAYPGEDWQPLRSLITTEPALSSCTPRAHAPVSYVS